MLHGYRCLHSVHKNERCLPKHWRSDASNFELERPLSRKKIKKVIKLMKRKLGGIIMKKIYCI